jgi:hypothetical protein
MHTRFGEAGVWFVTDDLRYVTVLPKQRGGLDEPAVEHGNRFPLHLAGVEVDMDRRALLFDRQTGRGAAVPKVVPNPGAGGRAYEFLRDVDSRGGDVTLLYGTWIYGYPDVRRLIEITPPNRTAIDFFVQAVAFRAQTWAPEQGRLVTVQYSPNERGEDAYTLVDHAYAGAGNRKEVRMTVSTIRRIIQEGAVR